MAGQGRRKATWLARWAGNVQPSFDLVGASFEVTLEADPDRTIIVTVPAKDIERACRQMLKVKEKLPEGRWVRSEAERALRKYQGAAKS